MLQSTQAKKEEAERKANMDDALSDVLSAAEENGAEAQMMYARSPFAMRASHC